MFIAEDIKPLITWKREVRKRKCSTIFFEGGERAVASQSYIGIVLKGNIEESSERWGGAHMGISKPTATVLYKTDWQKCPSLV